MDAFDLDPWLYGDLQHLGIALPDGRRVISGVPREATHVRWTEDGEVRTKPRGEGVVLLPTVQRP